MFGHFANKYLVEMHQTSTGTELCVIDDDNNAVIIRVMVVMGMVMMTVVLMLNAIF